MWWRFWGWGGGDWGGYLSQVERFGGSRSGVTVPSREITINLLSCRKSGSYTAILEPSGDNDKNEVLRTRSLEISQFLDGLSGETAHKVLPLLYTIVEPSGSQSGLLAGGSIILRTLLPSGAATNNPPCPPDSETKAIRSLSGDHAGSENVVAERGRSSPE